MVLHESRTQPDPLATAARRARTGSAQPLVRWLESRLVLTGSTSLDVKAWIRRRRRWWEATTGPPTTTFNQLWSRTHGNTLAAKVFSVLTALDQGKAASPLLRLIRVDDCLVGGHTSTVIFTARNQQAGSQAFPSSNSTRSKSDVHQARGHEETTAGGCPFMLVNLAFGALPDAGGLGEQNVCNCVGAGLGHGDMLLAAFAGSALMESKELDGACRALMVAF